MKYWAAFILPFVFQSFGVAQEAFPDEVGRWSRAKKGSFYLHWGYNRSRYTKSDIHFYGPEYDFTLYDLKAKDRPTPVSREYIRLSEISIPQYTYRLGYYLSDRLCLSVGLDHMKYVVQRNQTASLTGSISEEASPRYAGEYDKQSVLVTSDLLTFEHTDGLNLVSLELAYLYPLLSVWDNRLSLHWNVGVAGGLTVTKTDVKVFGVGRDNEFHIAGFSGAVKTGPRLDFWNHAFLSFETKIGYAVLPDVLIDGEASQRAEHRLGYLEYYLVTGFYFRLWNFKRS